MNTKIKNLLLTGSIVTSVILSISSCSNTNKTSEENTTTKDTVIEQSSEMQKLVNQYYPVTLTTDLAQLSENDKKMMPLLLEAAQIMDDLFWRESFGDKNEVLNDSSYDEATKRYFVINYGPWDRLNGNKAFIAKYGEKPLAANFYPKDMTKEEFEKWDNPKKDDMYSMVVRKEDGTLEAIPYHIFFKEEITKVSNLLKEAAKLSDSEGFKKYLELRAAAVLSDDYLESDMAWMDMKDNTIDFVVGPTENYEDALFGKRAAHEAFILVKDQEWTKKLAKYAAMLPDLQKGLPCDDKYKQEVPGSNSDLGAYDVVYYAGDCNAGSKTIAINLPNDERVQLKKGSRRLQLKNAMKAKFDNILLPISKVLITPEQRKYVQFKAFFENTMFHEVSHGLGIKNTINGKGTCREALKEKYSALEEGKADILGLHMVTELFGMGELQGDLKENYVTFMASIFRSIRFGASSAHGKANLLRFNYFKEMGAFNKNEDGTYSVDFDKMKEAMNSLSALILKLQGEGDYDAVVKLMQEKGQMTEDLQKDLDRLKAANIPVDITYNQGAEALGL